MNAPKFRYGQKVFLNNPIHNNLYVTIQGVNTYMGERGETKFVYYLRELKGMFPEYELSKEPKQ